MESKKSYKFFCRSYLFEGKISDITNPDDSIFVSDKGIFINKGQKDEYRISEITEVLSKLQGTLINDQKPFVIFGMPFSKEDADFNAGISLPEEMIHIDSHNWVTHFILTEENNEPTFEVDVSSIAEFPHQIEMMSPESKDNFIDKVELALKNIEESDLQKVVISRKLNVIADVEIDKRLLVNELMDSQPNCYIYSYNGFVGASPELLVEKFSSALRSLPMAGTRKRHAKVDEDDADIADLQTSEKDSFEHKIVIDDIVEKLNRVATNVTSSKLPHVVRLPHVAHLATSLRATCATNTSLLDLVTCLHPTPAVAGFPSTQAADLLREIEGFDRGLYGAPIGWIDKDGDGQCAIALRCAQIQGTKAQLYAGVGIVEGSKPENEWDETQAKFGVMRDAMMNITQ